MVKAEQGLEVVGSQEGMSVRSISLPRAGDCSHANMELISALGTYKVEPSRGGSTLEAKPCKRGPGHVVKENETFPLLKQINSISADDKSVS